MTANFRLDAVVLQRPGAVLSGKKNYNNNGGGIIYIFYIVEVAFF